MAHELKLPLIRMIDGAGGGSVKMLEDMGFTYLSFAPGWEHVVENLKTVPVVALALGPTAGLGAARMVAGHYSAMARGLSQIFTAGPAVVSGLGTGEHLDKEQLGGAAHPRLQRVRPARYKAAAVRICGTGATLPIVQRNGFALNGAPCLTQRQERGTT